MCLLLHMHMNIKCLFLVPQPWKWQGKKESIILFVYDS